MAERVVPFGIVGGGLMGREFASAAARWVHLADIGVRPEIAAVCDPNPDVLAWYERLEPRPRLVSDYRELLADDAVEAVYCAVPHNLHEELYRAVLRAGKHRQRSGAQQGHSSKQLGRFHELSPIHRKRMSIRSR